MAESEVRTVVRWLKDHTIQAALIGAVATILAVFLGVTLTERYRGSRETAFVPPAPTPSGSVSPTDGLRRGEAAREEVRRSRALRALVPEENDLRLSRAPRAVFAFVDLLDLPRFLRDPRDAEFRLGSGPLHVPREIEVHRLRDGSILIVGFVSRDVALQLDAGPAKGAQFTLYNVAWSSAEYLVSLPLADIKVVHDIRWIPGPVRALDLELK